MFRLNFTNGFKKKNIIAVILGLIFLSLFVILLTNHNGEKLITVNYSQCLENAKDLGTSKDCCDCLDADASVRKACRDEAAKYDFSKNTNIKTFEIPSTLGKDGNYSEYTTSGNQQECKQKCEAPTSTLVCGDFQFCRTACNNLPSGEVSALATTSILNIEVSTSTNRFSFGIQGDSHPERAGKMFNSDLYKTTLQNVNKLKPAFYFLLGDDFSIEKLIENNSYTQQTVDQVYLTQKSYLDALSMPIYLVNGNHEQEAKYLLDGTNNNPAFLAKTARAKFFDSPGSENGYYSFTYGNALFVVIDYYWHSDTAADNTAGAKNTEDKKQRDLWNNTLGDEQYQWFKKTLEGSQAKYKFVFSHHVLGTGRGGIENVKSYEWGGYNQKGVWEFDKMRPGWELPIHQLMVKNGVTIFFQGHDHLFAKQELDGVIYQEVPNPADDTYTAFNKDAYRSGVTLPNSGFLNVTVSTSQVKVDYIKSGQDNNGQSIYSYIIN